MNDDWEFQQKVQHAVDSYLAKRERHTQEIQNTLERESLIEQVQKLIVDLIIKLNEKFIMKKQVENEVLKLREIIKTTHYRTYSEGNKDDSVQRTLMKHETQINMILDHQAQLESLGTGKLIESSIKKQLETLQFDLDEQIKTVSRNFNLKQSTVMQILNDFVGRIERVEQMIAKEKKKK